METANPLIRELTTKVKQASLLWLEGFREACCLHRVVILCYRSRKLLIRTGQCFLLNGFIFLGSMFVLNSVVIPTLQWILPDRHSDISSQESLTSGSILKLYSFLRLGLIQLFYVFWFYPLYLFSFILSNIWYNEISKYGFSAMGKNEQNILEFSSQNEATTTSESKVPTEKPAGLGGVMIGIGEQVYSILLLSFFFLEVYATGFIPFMGKAVNFILLSWMYAYYCFEYKWNLSEVALDRRLDFFESNWAFFAGFGSPCVLAIFFFSPLISYGVMAILFPLFVLTATGSRAEQLIFTQRRKWKGVGLGRLPIFYAADTLSMRILSLVHLESQEQMQDNKAL
ncbi:protein EI24 homolog isoform X2 [Ricinus communis]|uniref:protein EI24 homolog isoform X2 n=1 Tax=Ricinus communis TaxID=3988 RepID=UPI0007726FB2|nr:protein EI24 homolog isoform X2 [Ricinus communis]|eukprot:XP_015580744.1 protein EI24 homolog isoform X2 [Ricinus communis]